MRQSLPSDTTNLSRPPSVTRRTLALLAGGASAACITAGFAASAPNPDAELLALRPRLLAALAEVSATEFADTPPSGSPYAKQDDWVSATGKELEAVCWDIVYADSATTGEGRALKAAAAMHQLRYAYGPECWPGSGEELAWDVLSEIAGSAYVPLDVPERLRHCEPERV